MKKKYILMALGLSAITANAATIANYDANPDNNLGTAAPSPNTQGWSVTTPSMQSSAVDNTGWQINDTASDATPKFSAGLTSTDFEDMHDNGWMMSASVRVIDTANFFGWGISAGEAGNANLTNWGFGGRERVALNFVEAANGTDVTIGDLSSGDSYLIAGGMNTYIDILIVGEALSENYEVFIDGTSRWSSTIGTGSSNSASDNVVGASSGSSGGVGRVVDYAAINLSSVPEPSSSALIGLGGLALILRRRK